MVTHVSNPVSCPHELTMNSIRDCVENSIQETYGAEMQSQKKEYIARLKL